MQNADVKPTKAPREMVSQNGRAAGGEVVRLTHCQAARSDGECFHPDCPQIRDGEPRRSGRSCPLPSPWDEHLEEI